MMRWGAELALSLGELAGSGVELALPGVVCGDAVDWGVACVDGVVTGVGGLTGTR